MKIKLIITCLLLFLMVFTCACTEYSFTSFDKEPSIEVAPYFLYIGTNNIPCGYYVKDYKIVAGVITANAVKNDGSLGEITFGINKWDTISKRE